MLLKVITKPDGTEELRHMSVSKFPEMALFRTDLVFLDGDEDAANGRIVVTYTPPSDAVHMAGGKRIEVPLQPDVEELNLREVQVTLHGSPTRAYDMGSKYNDSFSGCFGYRVVLVYLGSHSRRVLGSFAPLKRRTSNNWAGLGMDLGLRSPRVLIEGTAVVMVLWLVLVYGYGYGSISIYFLVSAAMLRAFLLFQTFTPTSSRAGKKEREEAYITFADCAPYLITSMTSLDNVSARLQDKTMDMTKFRPNIVISGAEAAFEEDFWTELTIPNKQNKVENRLLLTANCVRCTSINVDYTTGKMGKGEEGSVLKKLMKDRRVDTGARFSPVFGRYAFLPTATGNEEAGDGMEVRVGDEVVVSGRAEARSVYGECSLLSGFGCGANVGRLAGDGEGVMLLLLFVSFVVESVRYARLQGVAACNYTRGSDFSTIIFFANSFSLLLTQRVRSGNKALTVKMDTNDDSKDMLRNPLSYVLP